MGRGRLLSENNQKGQRQGEKAGKASIVYFRIFR